MARQSSGHKFKEKKNRWDINTTKQNTHLIIQAMVDQAVRAHTEGDSRTAKRKGSCHW